MTREREKVGEERGSAFECLYFSIHSIWLSIKVTGSNHHSCNTLQHTDTQFSHHQIDCIQSPQLQHSINKLQHAESRLLRNCHSVQHAAPKLPHCNTLQHTESNTMHQNGHTVTHHDTLQYTASRLLRNCTCPHLRRCLFLAGKLAAEQDFQKSAC